MKRLHTISIKITLILVLFLIFLFQSGYSITKEVAKKRIKDYKDTVRYYNPRLTEKQIHNIVSTMVYYCYVYELDPRLIMAMIRVESCFNTKAVSPCGALGLGQIMPENCEALGITQPFEPIQNVKGCIRILKMEYDRFKHLPYKQRVINAIAAYNAGYGAVRKYGGIPPYPETQNYVRLVIGYWRKYCGM